MNKEKRKNASRDERSGSVTNRHVHYSPAFIDVMRLCIEHFSAAAEWHIAELCGYGGLGHPLHDE